MFCLSWQATDALEMMLMSVLSPEVRCEWKLQDWEVAMISTVSILLQHWLQCSVPVNSL